MFSPLPIVALFIEDTSSGRTILSVGFVAGLASVLAGPILTYAYFHSRQKQPRVGRAVVAIALNAAYWVFMLFGFARLLAAGGTSPL